MNDVFGLALYGYWKGDKRTPHYLRRNDGFLDRTPTGHYFAPKLSVEEKKVIRYAKGEILDVGCGAGRVGLYLQNKGLTVHGIDTSPLALKVCKARGLKETHCEDIFKSKLPKNSFDTVILFGNNIGIAGTVKKAEKLLKKLFNLTKNGGHLLLTSLDVHKTKNKVHLDYHKANRKKGIPDGEVVIRVEYKKDIGAYFKWLHVDPQTLKIIAKKSGWILKKLYQSKDGQYSAVLEKPNK